MVDARPHLDGVDITAACLAAAAGQIHADERLLILTGWRGEISDEDYPALTRDAAEWLVAKQPALVGVDTPSVDGPTAGHAHELLLGAEVPVVELLVNLDELIGRKFGLYALPLAIADMDGAPVRAVAIL
ncbi:MAG TPA: cyclase family protein [Armatimonadota bacterium]|nr:cyclase family protein [Armatimonadota bacterium]